MAKHLRLSLSPDTSISPQDPIAVLTPSDRNDALAAIGAFSPNEGDGPHEVWKQVVDDLAWPLLENQLDYAFGVVDEIRNRIISKDYDKDLMRVWEVRLGHVQQRISAVFKLIRKGLSHICDPLHEYTLSEISHETQHILNVLLSHCMSHRESFEQGIQEDVSRTREPLNEFLKIDKSSSYFVYKEILRACSVSRDQYVQLYEGFADRLKEKVTTKEFIQIIELACRDFPAMMKLWSDTREFSVSFDSRIDQSDEPAIPAPEVLSTQVYELVYNALKWIEKHHGKEVTVRFSLKEDGALRIDVIDDGIGTTLPYEELFEEDFSDTRELGGSGAGLRYMRRCVESLFGGTLTCINNTELPEEELLYETGMTFTITIPPQNGG